MIDHTDASRNRTVGAPTVSLSAYPEHIVHALGEIGGGRREVRGLNLTLTRSMIAGNKEGGDQVRLVVDWTRKQGDEDACLDGSPANEPQLEICLPADLFEIFLALIPVVAAAARKGGVLTTQALTAE